MSAISRHASSGASALLAAAFVAVAFAGKGGNELGRITKVEIALILAGGLAAALGVAYGRSGHHGRGTVLVFGLLAALTATSIFWSIQPDVTWIEAGRTFSYFAVFAAGVAAGRLAPGGYPVLLRGALGAMAVICLYALASRVWPVQLGGDTEIYARIGQPFSYWNAVGTTAAMGIVPALWLGARRAGHPPANALAYPLIALFLIAIFLSYSRGSLLCAGIGVLAWFAFVPLRLRSLPVLLIPAVASAPILIWAYGRDEFTKDGLSAVQRAVVGPEFGMMLLVLFALLLVAGLAVGFQSRDWIPSFATRRRAGLTAVAVTLCIPLIGLTSVAVSGGIDSVGNRVKELTSEEAKTPGGPQRLTVASSTRGRYWRQAGRVFGELPVTGSGAGTFGTARLRFRNDQLVAQHAHGFLPQTMSDLGTLGLLAILAFAGAWLVSAARTTGLERHPERRDGAPSFWDADRVGTTAIAIAALVFGLQSAIDWTWFVPGPAVLGIALAGYVAGRGPAPRPADAPSPMVAAGPAPEPFVNLPRLPRFQIKLPPRPQTARLVPALLVLVLTLIAAWAVYQPYRGEVANNEALDLLAQRKIPAAQKRAEEAHDINPASVRPLWTKAAIAIAQNDLSRAQTHYQEAVFDRPSDPEAWVRLAEFHLYRRNDPQTALGVVEGALYLDPRSARAQTVFYDARRRERGEL